MGEILSVEEVGNLLELSTSAVWRLLQQGEIPGAKIGGQWRVRRDDLDRHFDLARARALASTRTHDAEHTWEPVLKRLTEAYSYDDQPAEFVVTRCLWCPEHVPAAKYAVHTTVCSPECAAELRRTFQILGWPVDGDLMLSPIHDWDFGDIEYWLRLSLSKPVEPLPPGMKRDADAADKRWTVRHERGPLRELLLLEHPLLRRLPPDCLGSRADDQTGRLQ
jgi:excisionase family DNA binding protein